MKSSDLCRVSKPESSAADSTSSPLFWSVAGASDIQGGRGVESSDNRCVSKPKPCQGLYGFPGFAGPGTRTSETS